MTAKELISTSKNVCSSTPLKHVAADTPLLDLIFPLLQTNEHILGVVDENNSLIGVIDAPTLLSALGQSISYDDYSTIVVECAQADFSASLISRAIEDVDAHLFDMLSSRRPEGKMRVILRIGHSDPAMAVHSLERYGFNVVSSHGSSNAASFVSTERLAALQLYLGV